MIMNVAKHYPTKMASQLRLPRAAKIGLLLSLLILAYVAGKFSGLSGNAEWWIGKVCSIASNAIFVLLAMEAWKQDAYRPMGQPPPADVNLPP